MSNRSIGFILGLFICLFAYPEVYRDMTHIVTLLYDVLRVLKEL